LIKYIKSNLLVIRIRMSDVYCTTIYGKIFKIVVGRCNYNIRSR